MSSSIDEIDDGKVFRIKVGNAWADVALFGSTVIGWHPASSPQESYSAIFLSKDTKPGKPFRGGIPLVFPVFGEVKDHGEVPEQIKNCTRHGFCRDRDWKLIEKQIGDSSKVSITMALSSTPELLEKFPCPFELHHTVTLTKDTLQSSLKIQHLSSSSYDSMPFHALFHTYLGLPSETTTAKGLKGVGYNDKVAKKIVTSNEVEQQGWNEEIDRVYQGGSPTLTISANDESGKVIILERSQTIPDTTLWNPSKDADTNMADLHQGGWKEFVCAEPGHVSSFAWLEKGKDYIATQTLTFQTANGRPSSTVDNSKEKASVEAGGATAAAAGVGAGAAAAAASHSKSSEQSKETDKKTSGPSDKALEKTCKEHYGEQGKKDDSEAAAALVIQRNYRKYVGQREADGKRLSPDARWGDAMGRVRLEGAHKEAKHGGKNDASSRWKRGGVLVGQLAGSPGTKLDEKDSAPVEGGPSLDPDPSLSSALRDRQGSDSGAPKHEDSQGMVGDVPGGNDNGKVDNIRSIAGKNQYGLKVIEKWTKGAPAQELSKVMEAQYWLEMVDKKHRYGSNLKHYHAAWEEDKNTKDNFFKWLDEGDGKDVDLPECPREQLQKEQVTYLSTEKRANYIVDVKEGRLVFRRNGKFVDTTKNRWRDLGNGGGIVELGEEEKAELRRRREERAARKGKKLPEHDDSSSSSSSSSSDEDDALDSEEEEEKKQRARHYGGNDSQPKRGMKSITPAGFWDKLLRKTVQENTWIYVYNSKHELFVGIKTTGKFQHSSFLYGGRVLSAGLLKAKDGYLTSLSPLSGHYRAGTAHFRFFVASLQDSGVNLENVTLSKSLMMLHGLEQYGKLSKKLKGKKGSITKQSEEKEPEGEDGSKEEDSKQEQKHQKDQGQEGFTAKLKSMNLRKILSHSKEENSASAT